MHPCRTRVRGRAVRCRALRRSRLVLRRRTLAITTSSTYRRRCRSGGESSGAGSPRPPKLAWLRVDHVIDLEYVAVLSAVPRSYTSATMASNCAARAGRLRSLQLLSVGELHRSLEAHATEFAGGPCNRHQRRAETPTRHRLRSEPYPLRSTTVMNGTVSAAPARTDGSRDERAPSSPRPAPP